MWRGPTEKARYAGIYTASFLEEGYKTGIYISPFIENFNERIEIGRICISDEDLAVYTDRVLEAVSIMIKGLQSPTGVQVITALALLYFKERRPATM